MSQQENQLLSKEEEARILALAERDANAGLPRLKLARHYWQKGELAEALLWADRGLALEPGNINAYRIRAHILLGLKQTRKAVETANTARAKAPQSVPAHLLTVRMLLADLQPGKAQKILDAILDLEPNSNQLQQLKSLQQQVHVVSRQVEQRPLDWIVRKFNRRLADVAKKEGESSS
jgi:tetratricopeptide (TPR) repeat protein